MKEETIKKRPLLIITGPTAVGKTSLSIQAAKIFDGEIISADSMQVYRKMDIGSAKVTKEEMEGIPHHLIDILDPWEEFDVAAFQKMAKQVIEDIYSRGKLPVIAGGTGFYIQALLYDINFQKTEDDGSIRKELENLEREKGAEYLHQMLESIDPESAETIHANNVKRVIRAIEYYRQTGKKISQHNQEERQKTSPYDFLYYVVNMDREKLYGRIEARVDQMMAHGLVEEVRKLKEMGCTRDMVSMQGLGYKEILDYLNGVCTLEEAVYVIKRDTRHFAKRQLTWFRRERDTRILNMEDYENDQKKILQKIKKDCEEEKQWR